MNCKSYVHQISEIGPIERVRLRASAVASEQRCVGVDRRRRESEGKAKIEGYMSVSDEEAHHRVYCQLGSRCTGGEQPNDLDQVRNLDSVHH